MADLLGPLAAPLTTWLLTYLAHSTVFIGGAWLLTRIFDLRPTGQDLVWKIGLLGGVITAAGSLVPVRADAARGLVAEVDAVALTASPGALRVPIDGLTGTEAAARYVTPGAGIDRMLAWRPEGGSARFRFRADVQPPSDECRAALRSAVADAPAWGAMVRGACVPAWTLRWYHLLLGAWLLGAVLGASALARDVREVHVLGRALVDAGGRARDSLGGLVRGTGLASVRLATSQAVDAPCVLPGRTIALPPRCEEELADAELRAVLAHELAHVTRRDVLWLATFRLAAALLWLQPLNRLALRRLTRAAELVCDDWALARTGEPLGLARSISRVAEWALPMSARPARVSMAAGGGRALHGRVRRILSGAARGSEPRWARILLGCALVAPVLLLPSIPGPSEVHTAILIERESVGLEAAGGLDDGTAEHVELQRRVLVRLGTEPGPGGAEGAAAGPDIVGLWVREGPAGPS